MANVAAFLLSGLSSAVTGEILYVDAGFHSVAVPPLLEQIKMPELSES